MPKKARSKPPEYQPEVMFTLEMREKMRGPWRPHAGNWVSVVAWTIELTQEQYNTCLAAVGASGRKARKVASHGA